MENDNQKKQSLDNISSVLSNLNENLTKSKFDKKNSTAIPISDKDNEILKKLNIYYDDKSQRFKESEGKKRYISTKKVLDQLNYEKEQNEQLELNEEVKPNKATKTKQRNVNRNDAVASKVTNDNSSSELDLSSKKNNDEISLLNKISSSLNEIVNKFNNIFLFLTKQTDGSNTKDAIPVSTGSKDSGDEVLKGSSKGGFGGLAGFVGFVLFAIFPMILKFIRDKREEISNFLEPAFKFVFEDIPNFLFETIPNFFTKTIPAFFKDKFENAKTLLGDLIDNVKVFASNIKKSIGEMIVKVGESMPDWLGGLKSGMIDFGKEMIQNADKSISEAENRKKQREQARKDKGNKEKLEQMASAEAERRKKEDPKIEDYEVTWDKAKNRVMIQFFYKGTDKSLGGDIYAAYDANKSLETGSFVAYNASSVPPSPQKNANAVPGVSDNTPGKPRNSGRGAISTSAGAGVGSGGSSGGSTGSPDASPVKKDEEKESKGGGTASSGASIASAEAMAPPSPSGESLLKKTAEATDPAVDAKALKPKVETINAPGAGAKSLPLTPGKKHDITYVPDPTPVLGNLASQLFAI